MNIKSFRKETSERSEVQNWVLNELSASEFFYFSGFEGCNENSSNQVTAVLDRVSVEVDGSQDEPIPLEQVKEAIDVLEGRTLPGKISFCECLGLPYTYILYNYEFGFVLRYELTKERIELVETYPSFTAFSQWIQRIKQWTSSKEYRELPDLPEFDKALRRAGCPWPTNIDCVAFTIEHHPVALVEFQNAKATTVARHNNNSFFLPYWNYRSESYRRGRDEQRWRSQDILRLQSGLPHLTIVWSQEENDVIVKLLDTIAFPDYVNDKVEKIYLKNLSIYRDYIEKNPRRRKNRLYDIIRSNFRSYHLRYNGESMDTIINKPPLSYEAKTFPFIYGKRFEPSQKGAFKAFFENILVSLKE